MRLTSNRVYATGVLKPGEVENAIRIPPSGLEMVAGAGNVGLFGRGTLKGTLYESRGAVYLQTRADHGVSNWLIPCPPELAYIHEGRTVKVHGVLHKTDTHQGLFHEARIEP